MKIDKFLDWDVNWDLTDDLTDVKRNVFVLCNLHAREMLLSFPAACVACCLLPAAALLHKCNWWCYVITG